MSCDDRLQNASSLNTVKVHLTKLMAMNVAGLPQLPPAGIYDFLDKTYKPLEGQIFSATYKESRLMPQTNNLRDILVVEVQNPFAATLKDIRDKVLAMCGEKVWKGIACTVWGDVCLWVEPTFVGIINADSTLWFKIEEATVFPCYPGTGFPHGGVSIKASLSPPTPQTPSTIPMIQMGTGFPHGGGSINANPLTPQILSPFHQLTQMATGFPHGGGSIKANPLTPQILSPIHQVTQMATGFPHGGGSIEANPLTPQILSPIHQVTQMVTGFPHGGGSIEANPLTTQILSPIHQVTQMATGFPHGGGSIKASLLTPEIPSAIHQVTQMATSFPHGGGSIHASPLAPQTFRLLSM